MFTLPEFVVSLRLTDVNNFKSKSASRIDTFFQGIVLYLAVLCKTDLSYRQIF